MNEKNEKTILNYDPVDLIDPARALEKARIANLRLLAEVGKMVLANHLDDSGGEQFLSILAHSKKVGVINDKLLAAIGRVRQPTANRWIHGLNVPAPAARETIIRKLILITEIRADNLDRGLPEDRDLENGLPEGGARALPSTEPPQRQD